MQLNARKGFVAALCFCLGLGLAELNAQLPPHFRVNGAFPSFSPSTYSGFADGTNAAPSMYFTNAASTGWFRCSSAAAMCGTSGGTSSIAIYGSGVFLPSTAILGWSGTGNPNDPNDLSVIREGGATLGVHNGTSTVAVVRVFGSRTSASNFRAMDLTWSGNDAFLQTTNAGATPSGNLLIRTTGAFSVYLDANNSGGTPFTTGFQINTSHHLVSLGGSTYVTSGSGLGVANVGANSCGTSAATIAGGNNAFVITVGATSGTQCRVAFTFAAATEWDCAANDDTTTVAVRVTPVDTTHTDFIGTFTAGDKVSGICFPR